MQPRITRITQIRSRVRWADRDAIAPDAVRPADPTLLFLSVPSVESVVAFPLSRSLSSRGLTLGASALPFRVKVARHGQVPQDALDLLDVLVADALAAAVA